ncbi:hypothetical protein [Stenotrophomonas rhizophila]|jgi:hypothetical protein
MKKVILTSVAGLLVGLGTYAAPASAAQVGIHNCTGGCTLTMPAPDPATRAFLVTMERHLNSPIPGNMNRQGFKNGDTMVICNGWSCVSYTKVAKESYGNGQMLSSSLPPEAGGMPSTGNSGGSGGTHGGSSPISGGTNGGYTGTVTVGDGVFEENER